ncbi:DNA polymerase IV [Isobaculum melis]|uniref:DNA polymerase IV n=1 Tax=Isobaculum melis TaxID=142588 RepID=A0A1H9RS49_9LACT|nr:DNA polymerase IV [Isobaculum melis]SER75368.1 DNA polymerase-4 [Isobaculum melis]
MTKGVVQFVEPTRDTSRKIIHIDMDAFFASVEERDHPEYIGKPLIIARHPKETAGRGVVTTANYEARKYGVHSAMSAQKAYELCPNGIFVPGNMQKYRDISSEIHQIFREYTDLIEPRSLDEAYLDVTDNKKGITSATVVAKMIQKDIYETLHLTSSAGVSYNKFIAKLASDFQKPRGITVIPPEDALAFLQALPIEKFHGIGKKTAEKMQSFAIYTGADLYQYNEMDMIQKFGKMGYSFYRKVRGIDNSPVQPQIERKSIGREHTYGKFLTTEEQVQQELRQLANAVAASLKKHQQHGRTVVIKVRYADYHTVTKRKSLAVYLKNEADILFYADELWSEVQGLEKEIRLLGITVTNLDPLSFENIQLPLEYR